ncbi:MAG: MBL fold metallo-hydrolase [Chloroflexi bacterium]|nr:MAG: MBL fold metallo-hydrolase [Chloroflexota bacterium]
MPSLQSIQPDLFLIDLMFQGMDGAIGAYLLAEGDGRFALIECGPVSTLEALEAGIHAAGLSPEALHAVLVTHIHLDHAGAAGTLARRYGATVYVHEVGAPHLADPSRLWASAARLYGDQMEPLWGRIDPVPREQLHALTDGDTVPLGRWQVQAVYTPGHASHHVVYRLDSLVFTGDLAGVRLPGSRFVAPPTPPPELHLETWHESLARLRALHPTHLLLTHFGAYTGDVDEHLEALEARLDRWGELILAQMRSGAEETAITQALQAEITEEIQALGEGDVMVRRQGLVSPVVLSVLGYQRYYRKHHPERLSP